LKGIVAHVRRALLTGLLIILPLVVTLWLFALVLRPVRRFVTPAVIGMLRALGLDALLNIPGAEVAAGLIGLVLTVVVIYVFGLVGSNIIGRSMVKKMDALALSIPLVKSVYGSARQLVETFYSSADRTFESVVLIEYPRRGVYTVGLVTAPTSGELDDRTQGEFVNVFVPTTPNPTSGVLVLSQRSDLVFLDMNVEEALRFVVSAGIVTPDRKINGKGRLLPAEPPVDTTPGDE
jgi:uncharacterized membrane protein